MHPQLKVFIGIITAHHPSRLKYQERARRDWLPAWTDDYKFYFGRGPNGEVKSTGDEVWLDCPDSREYMVLKNQAMFRDALENGYDYCLRICDDTFVNIPNFLRIQHDLAPFDYAGMMPCKLAILGSMKMPMRHFDYMHGGCGIWLSKKAMTMLAEDKWIGPVLPDSWPNEVEIGFGLKAPMSRTFWDDHWIGEVLKGNLPYNDPAREQVSEAYSRMGINIFEDNMMFLDDEPQNYMTVHDPGVTKVQGTRWAPLMGQVRQRNQQVEAL